MLSSLRPQLVLGGRAWERRHAGLTAIVGSNQDSGRAIRTQPICSAVGPADMRLASAVAPGGQGTDGQAEGTAASGTGLGQPFHLTAGQCRPLSPPLCCHQGQDTDPVKLVLGRSSGPSLAGASGGQTAPPWARGSSWAIRSSCRCQRLPSLARCGRERPKTGQAGAGGIRSKTRASASGL